MQEEVNQKTVALTLKTVKLTGRGLAKAFRSLLRYHAHKKAYPTVYRGKQTVKQLASQGQGMSNIEITDKNIKSFESTARKYGIDYALMKDANQTPPKYVVFFKGRDKETILTAFEEYSRKMLDREKRPSMLAKLKELREKAKTAVVDKVKQKMQEHSL